LRRIVGAVAALTGIGERGDGEGFAFSHSLGARRLPSPTTSAACGASSRVCCSVTSLFVVALHERRSHRQVDAGASLSSVPGLNRCAFDESEGVSEVCSIGVLVFRLHCHEFWGLLECGIRGMW